MKSLFILLLFFYSMLNSWAGQIIITHGGTYTFDVGNADPSTPAVIINTTEVVTLERCLIFATGVSAVDAIPQAKLVVDHCTLSCFGGAQGVSTCKPDLLIVQNCWINGASIGVYVLGDPYAATYGAAQISILQNRITDGGGAIQLNGVHDNPYVSIHHNEITNTDGQKYAGDLINIYRSSGTPGHPIMIQHNYVQGATGFNCAGIVTDGDTPDPAICTCHVDISYNQVVGCPWTGISLAFGFDEIAHDNTVITSGAIFCGMSIEGDTQYQPAWMKDFLYLANNTVGAWRTNLPIPQRSDVKLWYSCEAGNVTGTISPHDGMITAADEQYQWALWKQNIASVALRVGPE